jgi:heme/copper-type cytochrome/quinol oxidase subunit 4
MSILTELLDWPRERLAARVSAASYGSVLVLAALAVIDDQEVASGWGWELATGVGVATWIAHLYAEVVGDHLRHVAAHDRQEISRAMSDGLPILLATVLPAITLVLGRLDVVEPRVALWIAVAVAFLQLVGLGAFVGSVMSDRHSKTWLYAAVTAAFGLCVVSLKVVLGH